METKEILDLIKETLNEEKVNKFSIQIEWDKIKIEVEKRYHSWWLIGWYAANTLTSAWSIWQLSKMPS